jgi:hypothetical protein
MKTLTHKKKEYLFVTEIDGVMVYRLRGGRKNGKDILVRGGKVEKELKDTKKDFAKLKNKKKKI